MDSLRKGKISAFSDRDGRDGKARGRADFIYFRTGKTTPQSLLNAAMRRAGACWSRLWPWGGCHCASGGAAMLNGLESVGRTKETPTEAGAKVGQRCPTFQPPSMPSSPAIRLSQNPTCRLSAPAKSLKSRASPVAPANVEGVCRAISSSISD